MSYTSESIYKGQLRTEATHLKSGAIITTDAPTDNRGKGESFSPTDMVATALGSCILTIMGIKAMDADIDMEGAKAEVKKVMASDPRRISKVEVKISMPAKPFSDKEKKILERAAHACPVAKSLSDQLEEDIQIIWPL